MLRRASGLQTPGIYAEGGSRRLQARRPTRSMKAFLRSSLLWLALGLAALVLVNLISNPAFLRITLHDGHVYGVPVDILMEGSRTMLLALGMTLVIATGGGDLSVGSVVAIAGATCALRLGRGYGLGTTIVAAAAVGALAGAVNGLLVARWAIQPIVATLILMVAGRGIAQLL